MYFIKKTEFTHETFSVQTERDSWTDFKVYIHASQHERTQEFTEFAVSIWNLSDKKWAGKLFPDMPSDKDIMTMIDGELI